jgi:putative ABC transport system permease protein
MVRDLLYAFRALRMAPGFTLLAALTLALGIGANTAIFSLTRAVLLRPFPFDQPDRLVRITETRRGAFLNVSYPNFLDWRGRSRAFESMAICLPLGSAVMTGDERAEVITTGRTEGALFNVLGVPLALGRTFAPDEEIKGAPRVAVISDRLWRRKFSADPAIVGQSITLDGQGVTVVGVLPESFELYRTDAWFPLVPLLNASQRDRGNHPAFAAYARLRPHASFEAAQQELSAVATDLERQYPATNAQVGVSVRPLVDTLVGEARSTLVLLSSAVALVLLVACANVANVLLARGLHRARETSVRAALGATRARLVRLFLIEGLLLAVGGSALGILIAAWTVRAMRGIPGLGLPRIADATVDVPAVAFAAALSLCTVLLFAAVPAIQLSRTDLMQRLRQAGAAGGSRAIGRMRAILLGAEVALSVLLLAGAAMMIRTIERIAAVDVGFDAERLMSMGVIHSPNRYKEPGDLVRFGNRVLEEVSAIPGVDNAAVAFPLSIVGGSWTPAIRVVGREYRRGEEPAPTTTAVTDTYFTTMGIPLKRGRLFERGVAAGPLVPVVVSETFVGQVLGGGDPIGSTLTSGIPQMARMEVIGVVGDTRRGTLLTTPVPELYVPYDIVPVSDPTIVVRAASGDPLQLARAVDARVASIDPGIPSVVPRRVADAIGSAYRDRRTLAMLLTIFAGVALVLTAVGVAGVVSFMVARRTQEIGVRIALGASAGAVVGVVLRSVLLPVALGLAAGGLSVIPASRLLRSFLHQIAPYDPVSLGAAAVALLGAAALAAYLPARRATRIDPLLALREL